MSTTLDDKALQEAYASGWRGDNQYNRDRQGRAGAMITIGIGEKVWLGDVWWTVVRVDQLDRTLVIGGPRNFESIRSVSIDDLKRGDDGALRVVAKGAK